MSKKYYIPIILFLLLFFCYAGYDYYFKPHPVQKAANYLVKTSWAQTEPYSKFTPDSSYVGCWSVALAQILYFHQCKPAGFIAYETPAGVAIAENFDAYTFHWEHFVNQLKDNSPQKSIEQIAKFFYFSALVLKKNWGGESYLDKEQFPDRMKTYYACDIKADEYTEHEFLNSIHQIEALIQTEIDARRPVLYYFDNQKTFGHACLIDGYHLENSDFWIHLNLGWGGYKDGWYRLEDRFLRILNDRQYRLFMRIKPHRPAIAAK